jgi:dethiobiotin synthetase
VAEFACFVTGTDTGAGKTRICAGLMRALARRFRRVAGMKPVASGAVRTADGLRSEDALLLAAECTVPIPYPDLNPCLLEEPIAPHIAAARAGVRIDPAPIAAACARICALADAVVVEGVGGWRVPLAPDLDTRDLVRALNLPVVLVVGLRLGCINHARLTAEAVLADGAAFAGWIGNHVVADYDTATETIECLRPMLPAPLLGVVPYMAEFDPGKIARCLDPQPLLRA